MSRQRQRIERAVNARGYCMQHLVWVPIGPSLEMQGSSGGWQGEITLPDDGTSAYVVSGINTDALIGEIEDLPVYDSSDWELEDE